MTPAEAIIEFGRSADTLPEAALRWSLEHWSEAGPECLCLLEMTASGRSTSAETLDASFFIIHLCREKRESRAFPLICKLLEQADLEEEVLGDATTETVAGVLISTWNGDDRPLKRVIESLTADEFARGAAMDALAYIARSNRVPDAESRAYWHHLRRKMRPRGENYVWSAWAMSAANLGYADLAGEVEDLIARGWISYRDIAIEDFLAEVKIAEQDPTGMAGFQHDRIGPFTDTIGVLSGWYGFSAEHQRRAARTEKGDPRTPEEVISEALSQQQTNSAFSKKHSVPGRNDPCPCGSGKKYKRCCLGKGA